MYTVYIVTDLCGSMVNQIRLSCDNQAMCLCLT